MDLDFLSEFNVKDFKISWFLNPLINLSYIWYLKDIGQKFIQHHLHPWSWPKVKVMDLKILVKVLY